MLDLKIICIYFIDFEIDASIPLNFKFVSTSNNWLCSLVVPGGPSRPCLATVADSDGWRRSTRKLEPEKLGPAYEKMKAAYRRAGQLAAGAYDGHWSKRRMSKGQRALKACEVLTRRRLRVKTAAAATIL